MASPRVRKIADRIHVIVAEMLERRIKDPRLGFLTVTDVRLTGDSQQATIFYTVLGEEDDLANTAAEADKLARGLPVVQFRNRYRDVRGGYRWFEWEAKSIPEEGIIFAVARDITERMELEGKLKERAEGG